MSRFTSWRRPQDEEEAVETRPSFRPTFHVGPGMTMSNSKPSSSGRPKRMPIRLCLPKPQMGKHGLQKTPQPQRVALKYINTPQGQKVVRRNIENQQFDPQLVSAAASLASKKKLVSGSKIPFTSKPRAFKQLDVNRRNSAMPKKAEPKCSSSNSPLLSLEEYATRIAGEANAFKASQEIHNGSKYDLRNIALRNASSKKQNTITSATTNLESRTPLLNRYSWLNAKIPESPKLLLSVRKTSAIEDQALDYLTELSKSARPKKQEPTVTRTGIVEKVSFHIDVPAEFQTILNQSALQCTPIDEDQTEKTSMSLEFLQYKRDERICLKSGPCSPLVHNIENITENEAKQVVPGLHNKTEVLADKSYPKASDSHEFITLVKSLKDDQEKQVEIHRKQVEIHQKLVVLHQEAMEVHQKSLKSFQDFIDMQLIPLPGQASFIQDAIQENETISVNNEPQSTTKKRRSLRIAARRSGEISVCPPVDVRVKVEDWLLNQPALGVPPSITITDADIYQNIVIETENVNKKLSLEISNNRPTDVKTLAKNRRSVSKYRMLQSSFNGLLKTPMKTPITKSARKVVFSAVDTPSELSRRVQASLELLHDVDDTVN